MDYAPTFQPAYFYHPAEGIARRWCATPDDRIALLLDDARWRDTPCKPTDFFLFFEEHGIHSLEARTAWCVAMLNAESYLRDANGPFTYAPWWDGVTCVRPTPFTMVACCAFKHLDSGVWSISVGEVFQCSSSSTVGLCQQLGVAVLASDTITARHSPTSRFFLTEKACASQGKDYESAIRAGLVPAAHPLLSVATSSETLPLALVQDYHASQQELGRIAHVVLGADTAWNRDFISRMWGGGTLTPPTYPVRDLKDITPALEPEAAAPRGPGRPQDAEWRSWTLQNLIDILKGGLRKAQQELSKNKRLRFQDVVDATGYERRDLSRSMNKYGHTWKTIRTLLND